MKKTLLFLFLTFVASFSFAQTFEWRLGKMTYNPADPDGAGPATGQVSFTLQIHTTAGTVDNITQLSTGYAYQSAAAMVPTDPGCTTTSGTPANIAMSPAFTTAGFAYTVVSQCNPVSPAIATGGQTFDRRANGVVDNGTISIGTAWVDVFTVTLWTLGAADPKGGYVVINASEGGAPGEYTTYSVSDLFANQYPSNSLTFTTPLALSSASLPVEFTRFNVECSGTTGTIVRWATALERDNSHFEVERSNDGTNWTSLGRVNSNSSHIYEFVDKTGGQAVYRVKQVDLNGAFSYTTLVRTTCGSQSFFVNLYPVPAKDKLTLVVGTDKAVRTTVRVLDNNGRVVMTTPLMIAKGTNNFTLDVSHLPQGQYYIRGGEAGLEINQRFTITR